MSNLQKYQIVHNVTILDALKAIDANKKGFVLLVKDNKIIGTLSDGDIRRAFIKGIGTNAEVDGIANRKFRYLHIEDNLSTAVELFKDTHIKYLPILDANGHLVNLLTKNQMHVLLLYDIYADLHFNFESLDESIIDYEVCQRPWGFYKTTLLSKYFQSKILSVKPSAKLSLQSHNHREEYWLVTHGKGVAVVDGKEYVLKVGSRVYIPKQAKHRLINMDNELSLIVTEVQLGDYFGEDDIIRYEDEYGRDKKE